MLRSPYDLCRLYPVLLQRDRNATQHLPRSSYLRHL